MFLASGGYTVHPVPAPFSTAADDSSRIQLPNPPMNTGITRKKIIRNA
jgi:hypothetical protein